MDTEKTQSIIASLIASRDRVIDHYRMIELIGRGGMGAVWMAEDLRLKRAVALKFIVDDAPMTSDARRRLEIEAQACAALDHPAVCSIYDIGEADGVVFLVMPYIRGESLARRVQEGPIGVDDSLRIACQIAQGLEAAHAQGIIHRDIKSSNIIIDQAGQARILDFGLARVSWAPGCTSPYVRVGTPQYMSPEQLSGGGVDVRTDLWSLGVVFHEMLTGRLPFSGGTRDELIQAILRQPLRIADVAGVQIPAIVASVLHRMLAKDRDLRYSRATEVVASLRAALARRSGSVLGCGDTGTAKERMRNPSVAVLPFANVGSDPENAYFSDGLTDELINGLSHVHGLRVMSRTSAFAMKGAGHDIKRIGEILDVDAILEGSVRKMGNRVRITVQLVTTTDGSQMWSQRYDRELDDIFAIQEDIAVRVVASLQSTLLNRATSLFTNCRVSLETYECYLQGSYYLRQMSPASLEAARRYFEKAIQEDSAYGPAYAGMAAYHYQLGFYNMVPPYQALSTALQYAARSLELDDSLADSHRIIGEIHMDLEWDWSAAEQELQAAVALSPGQASARCSYMLLLLKRGRFAEARQELDAALACDPVAPYLHSALAFLHYYMREYDAALKAADRTLELDPNNFEVQGCLGLAHIGLNHPAEAISAFERARDLSGGHPLALAFFAFGLAFARRVDEARDVLNQLLTLAERTYVSPGYISVVYVGLGECEEAFKWLEAACEARDPLLTFLGVLPTVDPLRTDPRFAAIVRRVGLPERIAAHG